jgi:hypothetical protein
MLVMTPDEIAAEVDRLVMRLGGRLTGLVFLTSEGGHGVVGTHSYRAETYQNLNDILPVTRLVGHD